MPTLNEIAANHAKMAKTLTREPTEACERQHLVVGGFEVSSVDEPQHMPLHLIVEAQDNPLGQAAGYLLRACWPGGVKFLCANPSFRYHPVTLGNIRPRYGASF